MPSLEQLISHTSSPVWMMRQAGRYLPQYQEIRQQYKFLEVCRDPELASTVSLQPLEVFDLDFAIIFSDILLPLCDFGIEVDFPAGGGITVKNPNQYLKGKPGSNIQATTDAIKILRTKLNNLKPQHTPIIGFCGGAWTLATYIIQGGTAKEFNKIRTLMYTDPTYLKQLLQSLSESMAKYLLSQIEAGAEIVQIFETWAGDLGQAEFQEFVKPYIQDIVRALPNNIPKSLYIKNTTPYIADIADIGLDILSIDWKTSPSQTWHTLNRNPANTIKCLQGNLDPLVLTSNNLDLVTEKTQNMLQEYKSLPCLHITNLGHGITPEAQHDSIKKFIQTVKS